MEGAKLANRALFVVSVIVTGAIAGAFVWLLLFAMNLGITFIWERLPAHFGPFFPLVACLAGGLVIGLFAKRFGSYPEGVCYSILIMNCTTWLLDKYIRPTIYGAIKKDKKEAAAK